MGGTARRLLTVRRARHLRKRLTDAEALLWSEIRGRGLQGLKFRRQHPVPPYILDFAARRLKLAVEIDGHTHNSVADRTYDACRTKYLTSKGWTVVRFDNDLVLSDMSYVLDCLSHEANTLIGEKE